jgi:hypothetical protein
VRAAALALGAGVLAGISSTPAIAAQTTPLRVTVVTPTTDTLRSATPEFRVRVTGGEPADRPVTIGIQVSQRADFSGSLLFGASVTGGDDVRFTPPIPLPENTVLFWRATARSATGNPDFFSEVIGPRVSARWLELLSPNSAAGTSLRTRRPKLVWRSAAVASPPGPWDYQVTIAGPAGRTPFVFRDLRDTTFTVPFDLEINTPYRWSVAATVTTGQSTTAESAGSFVVVDDGVPSVTLLYQNFPNPFPSTTVPSTCIWFDLHRQGRVSLAILDVRGHEVRRLAPADEVPAELPAGRYGRGVPGNAGSCDPRFAWDGRTSDGRTVPSGLYLVHLEANGVSEYKKMLFRGR